MKFTINFFFLSIFLIVNSALSSTTTGPSSSPPIPTKSIFKSNLKSKPNTKVESKAAPKVDPRLLQPRPQKDLWQEAPPEEDSSTLHNQPGIVANRDGEWLWSDHLFNLSKNIDVGVEIIKPDTLKVEINSDDLEKIIEEVFKKADIIPNASPEPGHPFLPRFHVLIMLYSIPDGYTYYIDARLLESVKLERVKLDETVTMQAITWNQGSINIVSTNNFKKDLEKNVREIAQNFADRYTYFEKLRKSEKSH